MNPKQPELMVQMANVPQENSMCSEDYVNSMGLNALGQSVYDSMPPMIAASSRCINPGQEISFEGTLETMWHTSILI